RAGTQQAATRGRAFVPAPLLCNQSQSPTPTTSPTSSTTTTTPLVPPPSTPTTTVPSPPLADASWRFYVRIATSAPFPHNVDVPAHSTDAALDLPIRADQLPAFRPGDQVSGAEIAALGGDTLDRLTTAVDAYLASHPAACTGFATIVEVRWAQRVGP